MSTKRTREDCLSLLRALEKGAHSGEIMKTLIGTIETMTDKEFDRINLRILTMGWSEGKNTYRVVHRADADAAVNPFWSGLILFEGGPKAAAERLKKMRKQAIKLVARNEWADAVIVCVSRNKALYRGASLSASASTPTGFAMPKPVLDADGQPMPMLDPRPGAKTPPPARDPRLPPLPSFSAKGPAPILPTSKNPYANVPPLPPATRSIDLRTPAPPPFANYNHGRIDHAPTPVATEEGYYDGSDD